MEAPCGEWLSDALWLIQRGPRDRRSLKKPHDRLTGTTARGLPLHFTPTGFLESKSFLYEGLAMTCLMHPKPQVQPATSVALVSELCPSTLKAGSHHVGRRSMRDSARCLRERASLARACHLPRRGRRRPGVKRSPWLGSRSRRRPPGLPVPQPCGPRRDAPRPFHSRRPCSPLAIALVKGEVGVTNELSGVGHAFYFFLRCMQNRSKHSLFYHRFPDERTLARR